MGDWVDDWVGDCRKMSVEMSVKKSVGMIAEDSVNDESDGVRNLLRICAIRCHSWRSRTGIGLN